MPTVYCNGSAHAVEDPYVLEVLSLHDGDHVSTREFFRIRALEHAMTDTVIDLKQIHECYILTTIFWREFFAKMQL